MRTAIKSKNTGSVLVLSLVALIILLVIGVGLLNLGMQSRLRSVQDVSEISARCAADAGLAKAIAQMDTKLEAKVFDAATLPNASYERLPNTDATYSYKIDGNLADGYTLECVGNSGRAQRSVTCDLELEGLFEYAIFMQGDLVLKSGSTITGYNYEDDEILMIGTSSTTPGAVDAKTGVVIEGDVIVGVDGDPEVVINSTTEAAISGEIYTSLLDHDMPTITVPDWLAAMPSQGVLKNNTTVTASGKYDSIEAGPGEIIIVDGDITIYVTGDIRLKNGSEFQVIDPNVNPNASLVLYLGGTFIADVGSVINNLTKEPKKFQVFGLDTCDQIEFKNSDNFYGSIYAPNADIIFHNAVDIYGSVIGATFEQKAAGNFYYDAALRTVSADDIGVHFVVDNWREQ